MRFSARCAPNNQSYINDNIIATGNDSPRSTQTRSKKYATQSIIFKIYNLACLSFAKSGIERRFPAGKKPAFQFRRRQTYRINLKFSRSRGLQIRSTLFLLVGVLLAHARACVCVGARAGKPGQKQFDYPLERGVMTPLESALKIRCLYTPFSEAAYTIAEPFALMNFSCVHRTYSRWRL